MCCWREPCLVRLALDEALFTDLFRDALRNNTSKEHLRDWCLLVLPFVLHWPLSVVCLPRMSISIYAPTQNVWGLLSETWSDGIAMFVVLAALWVLCLQFAWRSLRKAGSLVLGWLLTGTFAQWRGDWIFANWAVAALRRFSYQGLSRGLLDFVVDVLLAVHRETTTATPTLSSFQNRFSEFPIKLPMVDCVQNYCCTRPKRWIIFLHTAVQWRYLEFGKPWVPELATWSTLGPCLCIVYIHGKYIKQCIVYHVYI